VRSFVTIPSAVGHRRFGRHIAAIGITALLAFASTGGVAAAHGQQARIVAPKAVRAPRSARFTVRVSAPAKRVAFFVDNRRRWVTRSARWRFRRSGRLRTARMASGRHRLRIRVKLGNGRVVSARRVLYVAKTSGTREHGHKSKEPTSTEATPTESASTEGGLLFNGSHISDFALMQAAPGAITEVSDPAGSAETVFKMKVSNEDVYPITPTENPRAQLLSPSLFQPETEYWWHSKFFLPADFPSSVPGWLTLLEGPYGPPYEGPPPWHIEVSGSTIQWQRNSTYNWDVPWHMPLVRNQWVDVLVHGRFGTDGWVEMWINGQQVNFFEPGTYNPSNVASTQRLNMKTMDSSNDGGSNFAVIQNYRKVGMFESVTVYHGPMKIGTTRSSVGG
jgi:Polysaccharide lyase